MKGFIMPDVFDEMTKQELATWIRKHTRSNNWPRKSEVLFMRWQKKSDDLIRATKKLDYIKDPRKWGQEWELLQKSWNRLDLLYKRYEAAREKEKQPHKGAANNY
jgi:hypothetical protein